MRADFPGWETLLTKLPADEDLSAEEAAGAMGEILEGRATDQEITDFALGLRNKGETVEEITGLIEAMMAAATPLPLSEDQVVVDTCGTGGDRSGTINVSTIAALVVAGAGVKVCKHGNRAASSQCGSADVLEALGVKIEAAPNIVVRCIEEAGIGFCFAPLFHPALRHAAPARKKIGVPTVFNFLGPLANPGRVTRQVIGVSDPRMAAKIAEVLIARGSELAMVVHGDDGLDELTTTSTSQIHEVRNGASYSYTFDPRQFGFPLREHSELVGGDATTNAAIARAVLSGESGAHRDIVVLNAAAALLVAGASNDWEKAIHRAQESLDDGRAAQALTKLVEVSNTE